MRPATHITLASIVAGLLLAYPALGQTGMDAMPMPHSHGAMGAPMGMGGGDSHFMMLLKSANLTSAQHAQVREILQNERAQMKPVYEGMHAVHEQLAAKLLRAGAVTAADLAPIEQKAVRYQEQIDRSMIETALAIRNVLTPEQIARLAQVHQKLQNLHAQIRSLMGPEGDESPEQPN
jgi:Spy/CpxP family protein refolding chaperone